MKTMNKKLWWVGTRLADLHGSSDRFTGAIVASGGGQCKNLRVICLEELTEARLNYNNKSNMNILGEFYVTSIKKVISEDPESSFVFYGRIEDGVFASVPDRVQNNISPWLFDTCNDKERFRRIVRNDGILTLTDKVLPGNSVISIDASSCFPGAQRLVAQEPVGFGGHQTYILPQGGHWLKPEISYLVSPFLEGSVPVNVHLVIFSQGDALVFPGSVQLIEEDDGRILYMGGDYGLYQHLTISEKENCQQTALQCGRILQNLGYRGVAGIDILLAADGTAYFLELNPRFQSSTPALDQALAEAGFPLVIDAHLAAFREESSPYRPVWPEITASFFAPLVRKDSPETELQDGPFIYDVDDARSSAFSANGLKAYIYGTPPYPLKHIETGSTLARVHFGVT